MSCYAAAVDDLKIGGFSRGGKPGSRTEAEVALNELAWFSLSIKRTDDFAVGTSRGSHGKPLELARKIVRGFNRSPFPPHLLETHVPGGPAIPLVLSTAADFPGGKAEFIQLVAKDSEPEAVAQMD